MGIRFVLYHTFLMIKMAPFVRKLGNGHRIQLLKYGKTGTIRFVKITDLAQFDLRSPGLSQSRTCQ